MNGIHHLRVLIANQRVDRLEALARVVTGLGHEVIAREIHVSDVAAVTARERPDVALVGLGESAEHALSQISEIVAEAFCPVIALLEEYDGDWVNEAASRGVFAYIVDTRPEELQSAIDITLRRFAEHQSLLGAFDRRNAEILREAERVRAQQRQVLELHDGVVQSLSVAHLALELDREDESRVALLEALENARAIVSRSLDELGQQGVPLRTLIRDAAPAQDMSSNGTSPQGAPTIGVLICDDNAALRRLLRAIVDAHPRLRVVGEAADGNEAIAEATSRRPDVILLDLAMPNRSGLERYPRARRVVPSAQIVVLSGFASANVAEEILELGAVAYLQKGVSPDEILAAIEHAPANVATSITAG